MSDEKKHLCTDLLTPKNKIIENYYLEQQELLFPLCIFYLMFTNATLLNFIHTIIVSVKLFWIWDTRRGGL